MYDKAKEIIIKAKTNIFNTNLGNQLTSLKGDGLDFKEINYKKFCDYVNTTMKQRSVIFVVGDFYGDVDLSEIAYKNDLYALIVRDRLEEYPLLNGEYELVNATNLKSSEFNITKNVAKKYKELLDLQDEQLKEHFLKHRITHGKIYTDDDIFLRLSQIIKG